MKDDWRDLPAGPDVPEVVWAMIEIPKGSRNKYEYSKEMGKYILDRVLHSPMHYPGEYGFIPQTLYDDGDPMDIMVLMNEETYPGCAIKARPVALMRMVDDGEKDDKILAVPDEDPSFDDIQGKEDVEEHVLREIAQFFRTYKDLEEGKEVEVNGWDGKDKALQAVEHSMDLFERREK
ncbi:MAG: inorganic diphosphatase [Candidatus Nanohaloarchaeota archaeon QJJ-7]|nr:inorganic diphosphatase [Candidatus Nanohaloarchaeota archaeon QJJ-7]